MKTREITAVFLTVLIFGIIPTNGSTAVNKSTESDTDWMSNRALLSTSIVTDDNSASNCEGVRLILTDKGLNFEGCTEKNRECCDSSKLKKVCHSGEIVLHPDKTLELVGCLKNVYQYNVCKLEAGKVGFKIKIENETVFPSIFIKMSKDGTYRIPNTVTDSGGYIVTFDDGSAPIFQHKNENGENIWFRMKPVLTPSKKLVTGKILNEGEELLAEKKSDDGRMFYSFKSLQQQRDRWLHEFCPL